jgi:alpha-L-arabinofuranosidase
MKVDYALVEVVVVLVLIDKTAMVEEAIGTEMGNQMAAIEAIEEEVEVETSEVEMIEMIEMIEVEEAVEEGEEEEMIEVDQAVLSQVAEEEEVMQIAVHQEEEEEEAMAMIHHQEMVEEEVEQSLTRLQLHSSLKHHQEEDGSQIQPKTKIKFKSDFCS